MTTLNVIHLMTKGARFVFFGGWKDCDAGGSWAYGIIFFESGTV